jgi:prepilin-type N-terminal cleavage/methylation domain-containing protein
MIFRRHSWSVCERKERGLTLIEMLIATGIGAIMLTIIVALTAYAERSFAVTSSHVDLSSKSRYALDKLTRELRQATAVISCDTNLPFKTLTLTNAIDAFSLTVSWDADVKSLRLERTGPTTNDNWSEKLLGNCERWDFTLCQRAPTVGPTDVSFNPASSLADCKLILMSWSCRQEVYGKLETENVQEMQIALRNKVN